MVLINKKVKSRKNIRKNPRKKLSKKDNININIKLSQQIGNKQKQEQEQQQIKNPNYQYEKYVIPQYSYSYSYQQQPQQSNLKSFDSNLLTNDLINKFNKIIEKNKEETQQKEILKETIDQISETNKEELLKEKTQKEEGSKMKKNVDQYNDTSDLKINNFDLNDLNNLANFIDKENQNIINDEENQNIINDEENQNIINDEENQNIINFDKLFNFLKKNKLFEYQDVYKVFTNQEPNIDEFNKFMNKYYDDIHNKFKSKELKGKKYAIDNPIKMVKYVYDFFILNNSATLFQKEEKSKKYLSHFINREDAQQKIDEIVNIEKQKIKNRKAKEKELELVNISSSSKASSSK